MLLLLFPPTLRRVYAKGAGSGCGCEPGTPCPCIDLRQRKIYIMYDNECSAVSKHTSLKATRCDVMPKTF